MNKVDQLIRQIETARKKSIIFEQAYSKAATTLEELIPDVPVPIHGSQQTCF